MKETSKLEYLQFDDIIPVSSRILVALNVGILGWYAIVFYCTSKTRLNILSLLSLSYNSHKYDRLDSKFIVTGEHATVIGADFAENSLLATGIFSKLKKTFIFSICVYTAQLILFLHYYSMGEGYSHKSLSNFLGTVAILRVLHIFFYKPMKNSPSVGEYRAFSTLKRISLGKINAFTMRTNDILISDTLISYGRVISDFSVALWSLFFSSTLDPKIELIVLLVPVTIRLKQCWFEWRKTEHVSHLLNFIKYSTNIIPLVINMIYKGISRRLETGTEESEIRVLLQNRLPHLQNYWYFCSFINSTYSFIWDVKMDWGLGILNFLFYKSSFGIAPDRPQLEFGKKSFYLFIIVLNFCLRFIWVMKYLFFMSNSIFTPLTIFLYGGNVLSAGYFCLEMLEIFRRWLWIFLKLENDHAKNVKKQSEDIEMAGL